MSHLHTHAYTKPRLATVHISPPKGQNNIGIITNVYILGVISIIKMYYIDDFRWMLHFSFVVVTLVNNII